MPLTPATRDRIGGTSPPAIQEFAGHQSLSMTQRYMHLSPVSLDDAIRLLDQPVRRRSQHGMRAMEICWQREDWMNEQTTRTVHLRALNNLDLLANHSSLTF